ncbi:MAG: Tim44/TimA family putative adaptor protein [Alphaproteobacteria bacterium]|nr:Tim44/TimA family putative adaptor protein [Alphaproteobacteria bacterium]
MPADLLLYALIAAGLVFWLKSILGKRDEDEESRPSTFLEEEMPLKIMDKNNTSNVVNLDALAGITFILPRNVRIDNKTTENLLVDLSKKHPNFNLSHFAQNVETAFKMIIEAFADGDLDTLEDLLDDPVYHAFESTIKDRHQREEFVETEVLSVEKIDITEASLQESTLMLTVRFTAREICLIKNKEGDIISGDPDKITQMVDVWVFGKDIESSTPEWLLYETRDDEVEDHKTPIPDAGSNMKDDKK